MNWRALLRETLKSRKRKALIKKEARAFALRLFNNFRYSYPPPTFASRYVDIYDKIPDAEIKVLSLDRVETRKVSDYGSNESSGGEYPEVTVQFTCDFKGEMRNASVFGAQGQVIADKKTVLTDVVPEMSRNRDDSLLIRKGSMPNPERFDGTLAVLGCAQPYNFFHWLMDAFPRLGLLDPTEVIDAYYISCDKPFQKEYLKARGIPLEKIIQPRSDLHIIADRLLFTSLPGDNSRIPYSGQKDQKTLDFVAKTFEKPEAKPCKRIYVMRRGKRTLQPSKEIEQVISDAGGFESVYLEDLSAIDQAMIFHQSNTIVAPHGAGLANIVHCQPGTKLIECLSSTYQNRIYCNMAAQLGIKYFNVIGLSGSKKTWDVGADVVIDINDFKAVLSNCLDT